MRYFFGTLLLAFSVFSLSAFALDLSQCVVPVSSGDKPVLAQIFDMYKQMRASKYNDTQDICAVRFTVKDNPTASPDSCKFSDPSGAILRKPMIATMDFRDSVGKLYTVDYQVCKDDDPSKTWINPNPLGGGLVTEVNFIKCQVFDVPSNNENNDCNVNTVVTKDVCAPSNYRVFAWQKVGGPDTSSGSHYIDIIPSATDPRCVTVSFLLKGAGYKDYGSVGSMLGANNKDCIEHGKFNFVLELRAVTSGGPTN